MTLHQMQIFRSLVELQSTKRTAEALFITPPSVSAQVKAMEQSLGLKLITRRPAQDGGVMLTEEGAYVYKSVCVILDEYNNLLKYSKSMNDSMGSSLTVLTNSPIATYVMPQLMNDYAQQNLSSAIKLDIRTDRRELLSLATSHGYDIFIVPGESDEDTLEDVVYRFQVPILLVANNLSAADAADGEGSRDLIFAEPDKFNRANASFILPSSDSGTSKILKQFFRENDFSLRNILEISDSTVAKKLLYKMPNCYGFLSLLTVIDDLGEGKLRLINTVPELPRIKYAVVAHANSKMKRQVSVFVECLKAIIEKDLLTMV